MKKVFHLIFCSLLLLLLFSCEKKNKQTQKEILKYNEFGKYNLSEIFKKSDYIKLHTDTHSLIGYINKIDVFNNRIYVLDEYYALALFVFDFSGNLMFKISNHGKGPSEFIAPLDFIVNDSSILLLADRNKVLKYNIQGKYEKEFVLNQFCDKFYSNNDEYVFYSILTNVKFKS